MWMMPCGRCHCRRHRVDVAVVVTVIAVVFSFHTAFLDLSDASQNFNRPSMLHIAQVLPEIHTVYVFRIQFLPPFFVQRCVTKL